MLSAEQGFPDYLYVAVTNESVVAFYAFVIDFFDDHHAAFSIGGHY